MTPRTTKNGRIQRLAPLVAQTVWIEETLEDAPGGVAEKPNGGNEQQRMAEWLSEDGRECAARPRDASACIGCDLKGQCADDHVEDTLHQEAHTGEPLDRAKTVHGFIWHADFSLGRLCCERSRVGWIPGKARRRAS